MKTIINKTITVTAIGAFLSAYFERNTGFLTTDPDRVFGMPDGKQVKTVEDVENWVIDTAEEIKRIRNLKPIR